MSVCRMSSFLYITDKINVRDILVDYCIKITVLKYGSIFFHFGFGMDGNISGSSWRILFCRVGFKQKFTYTA